MRLISALLVLANTIAAGALASPVEQTKGTFEDKFRQLDEVLPTPNGYRTASGAPGHAYWQQQVDYDIAVELDDAGKRIVGSGTITYTNNSPDTLRYLWVQLDQNRFARHSDANATLTATAKDRMGFAALRRLMEARRHDGGYDIASVTDAQGGALTHRIVDTMMRIDLPQPLASGQSTAFSIDWSYNIPEGRVLGARGGWEQFEADGNRVYFIAQWFPRLAAYTDTDGWNNKQFLGAGEFALEFGDYDVAITAPADHIVASTGELVNAAEVLTARQRDRLADARTADKPVFIVTPKEAERNQRSRARDKKTWRFQAQNVRDFAFASSRKFIWDAQGHTFPDSGRTVMAMSFYPNEGLPLWDRYSTHSVVHALDVYSRMSFEYPYPVAISVNGPLRGGMEYPMITSNGPRPTKGRDGKVTYSRQTKYGLIGVIIHEIGHIYFPMTVNSDERQWTWMDEGINTFLQDLAKQEWEADFPALRSDPRRIVDYMLSERQVPIMTQSDSILQFANNAYNKPATALNILRETVLGRELFDFAFAEYSRRWMFKRPQPADFFRTMEDASARDLDWFWRGWFYTTDHVDISLDTVTWAQVDTENPEVEETVRRQRRDEGPRWITEQRAEGTPRRVDRFPELRDFYNENDPFTVSPKQRRDYAKLLEGLKDWQKELLDLGENLYFLDFSNVGGLVMPIILDIEYTDGSREELRIPAEIWRRNARHVTKLIVRDKEIAAITVDPHLETADADLTNNHWPRKPVTSRIELFKQKQRRDMMREFETEDGGGKRR